MRQHQFYCDPKDINRHLYIWNGAGWNNGTSESEVLRGMASIFAEEHSRGKLLLEKTLNFIKGRAMNTEVEAKPPHVVAFQNGLLNAKTGEFQDPNPSIFAINVIPHKYDPKAECPNWVKFIESVTHEGDRKFLREWVGYNFYTAVPRKMFVVLIGDGDNGKSIFMDLFIWLLGDQNVTNITVYDLSNDEFKPAELYHKLANIADDIGGGVIYNASRLKVVASGGKITVHNKFGQPFDMWPYAKISYACNEAPEIRDTTDAVKSRLRSVEFPFKFKENPNVEGGEKQARDKQELENELLKEIPGIINWALEGLKRLIDNGFKFSYSQSTEEMWKFYQRSSNPVQTFVEECLEFTDSDLDYLTRDQVFKAYKEWEHDVGLKRKIGRDTFWRRLKNAGLEATQSRTHDMKRIYLGVKCNNVTGGVSYLEHNQGQYVSRGHTHTVTSLQEFLPEDEKLAPAAALQRRLGTAYGDGEWFTPATLARYFKTEELLPITQVLSQMVQDGEAIWVEGQGWRLVLPGKPEKGAGQ
jgi:P4 family phage/plasmid primase-like protien